MYEKRYKLTDQDGYTRRGLSGETKWELGVWHEATGDTRYQDLCSDAWIHWYEHPLLAILLSPIHANTSSTRLWECEIDGESRLDGQLKGGSRRVRVTKELPIPKITQEQKIEVAIRCAYEVCSDRTWRKWADNWLSGKDRSSDSAYSSQVGVLGKCKSAYEASRAVKYQRSIIELELAVSYAVANASIRDGAINLIRIAEQVVGKWIKE